MSLDVDVAILDQTFVTTTFECALTVNPWQVLSG
jgi:hypothetical protein